MSTNYALDSNGSTATATSEILSAALAINGVNYRPGGVANDWLSAGDPASVAQELVIDFNATRNISGWRLFQLWNQTSPPSNSDTISGNGFGGAYGAEDYTVEVYDGSWHTIATKTGQTLIIQSGTFTPGNYTKGKIRITKSTGGGLVDVSELEFWDTLPDLISPTVSITTPSGTTNISGNSVNIQGTCSDNIEVVGIQLKLNGSNWGAEITGSGLTSFNVNRDSFDFPNGTYTLTAVVRDPAGNTTTSSGKTVNIQNTPTPGFSIPSAALINEPVQVTDESANAASYAYDKENNGSTDSTDAEPEFTFTVAGTYTVKQTVTNTYGSNNVTHNIVISEHPPVPESRWSNLKLVPLKDSLFWNALDVAEDATEIGDFSGNDNKLAVASSEPVLQTDVINGKPGVYFDGTNNPLKFTTDITLKHLFLVVKFDGATFTGNEGLLSGVAATSILRGNGSSTTKFANLSIGSGFVYKKNYVALTESTQIAPMNSFAILELVFPNGISLDGIQIGQDTTNTGRKWKGWFIEQIGYGEEQDDCNRRSIYEYFALKFWLWRYKSDNYPYFPFVFNRASKHRSTELAEISEAEGLRGSDRVVRYLDDAPLHSYDLEFNYRFYLEYLATVQFLNERRLHLPFWIEDIERTFERRMTRITELTDNGNGSPYKFDYSFGVKDY